MHVFQPFTLDKLEINPYTISGKPGVCITVDSKGKLNTHASSNIAFGRLWNKDVIFVFVGESKYTKELLDNSDFFSVTFFEDKYTTSLKFLKSISGRDEDKIKTIGFNVNKKIDIPFIDEGNLVFLCDKLASIPFKDDVAEDAFINPHIKSKFYSDCEPHYMFVGEILEVIAR